MPGFKKTQKKVISISNRIRWKHALTFYAVFLIAAAPFIRSDVRERKLFMHRLADEISQAIDDAAKEEKPPRLIRLYFSGDAPHANHYGVLLRGLIAVARPEDKLETVDNHDVIPADDWIAKEYGRDDGYVIEFCVKDGAGYHATLIHSDAGQLQMITRYILPGFEDSRVQICE